MVVMREWGAMALDYAMGAVERPQPCMIRQDSPFFSLLNQTPKVLDT